MDGEQNGTQAQQVEQQQENQTSQQQEGQQEAQGKHAKETGADAEAYEKQLAERDSRIAELEAQIAEAAKSAEAADGLRAEIAALKEQGESDRIEFSLLLAGCRNVKAAKAVLDDHGGDVDALKVKHSRLLRGLGLHLALQRQGRRRPGVRRAFRRLRQRFVRRRDQGRAGRDKRPARQRRRPEGGALVAFTVYYKTPAPERTGYYAAKYRCHWMGSSPRWGKWEYDDDDDYAGNMADAIDMVQITIERI